MEGQGLTAFLPLIFLVLYFCPTIIAKIREHPRQNSILALNFFLGWTIIGWIAVFFWSVSAIKQSN